VIESFFMPLNAFPTQEMRLIVSAEGFDDVTGHSIAALTAMNSWFLPH
jgi:hypothetical protein